MADMTNRAPVSNKASAGVAGVDNATIGGIRLAEAFFTAAKAKAESSVKEGLSMKDKLIKLTKLTKEELNGFFATMGEHKAAIEKEAKDANFAGVKEYFAQGGKPGAIAYSLYTEISMWNKMAYAIAGQWAPSAAHIKETNWQALSKEATEFKAKATTASKPMTDAEKAEKRTKDMKAAIKQVAGAATRALVEGEGDAAKLTEIGKSALPDVVAEIMKLASPEEFEAVIARLSLMREAALKAREEMGKAVAKAKLSKEEKAAIQKQSASASVGRDLTAEANKIVKAAESEKAQAKAKAKKGTRATA